MTKALGHSLWILGALLPLAAAWAATHAESAARKSNRDHPFGSAFVQGAQAGVGRERPTIWGAPFSSGPPCLGQAQLASAQRSPGMPASNSTECALFQAWGPCGELLEDANRRRRLWKGADANAKRAGPADSAASIFAALERLGRLACRDEFRAEASFRRAEFLRTLGRDAEARIAFLGVSKTESRFATRAALAATRLSMAARDWLQALQDCQSLLWSDALNRIRRAEAVLLAGRIHWALGNAQVAIELWKSVAEAPGRPLDRMRALDLLARERLAEDDVEAARRWATRAEIDLDTFLHEQTSLGAGWRKSLQHFPSHRYFDTFEPAESDNR